MFRRDWDLPNAARSQLADHHLHQMTFQQNSTDDNTLKLNPRLKSLDELSYPLDPEVPGCVSRFAASLQAAYAIQNAINLLVLLVHPPFRTRPAVSGILSIVANIS
jgi:hypothetical protein